ncbi:hypothetical protein J2X08_001212 [Rhizobium rosettiformans]|nr:hypothetical protein [Rhizobium rosettiformans]MDR7063727.1 hypothetical protein [Rhizobium rosettiformans]
MTTVSSNIFLFPSPPTFQLDFIQRVDRDQRLARLNNLGPDERADYVASILRPVIRIAKQKGRGLESLPPQLRGWLVDLCDAGDPTCRIVLDWLMGNSRYCSDRHGENA